jgi:hypothetical protein
VAQHFEDLGASDYEVWHPAQCEAANNQKHNLKEDKILLLDGIAMILSKFH